MVFKAMMKENIKKFIEQHIDLIDTENYEEFLNQWWFELATNLLYNDEDFEELMSILDTAGLNFTSASLEARRSFIKNVASQVFHEALEGMTYHGKSSIPKTDIMMFIDSYLGFTADEVEKLLDDVAENEYNLEVDFTCYYIR